ncbi:MAG: ribonuclease J [Parcubacteria group bacterium CG11_big_fil_rev_8_21_14_0_20_39_22]|nr:MAG: ribonuclease J [Parcubacteria group bacterium CG11_big_fil_rev_8_21_14_0_20_39_22]
MERRQKIDKLTNVRNSSKSSDALQRGRGRSNIRVEHFSSANNVKRDTPASTTSASGHSPNKQHSTNRNSNRNRNRSGGKNDYSRRPPMRSGSSTTPKKTSMPIPELSAGDIRVIPLGGVEEIGKNMTAVHIGDDIIVIDAGFQFTGEETPGIDYILPNTKYLEDRKDKVKALIVTHGHLDHIGGIPYIMEKIGNPTIYTRELTSLMIRKRQEEFPNNKPLDIKVVEKSDRIKVGSTSVRFFSVTHTIPDSMGIIIETPYGNIVTPGDFKLTHEEGEATEEESKEYSIFEKEKTLLLLADSTNVENPGFSTPEYKVHEGIEEIIKNVKGRLIIGTFASQFVRIVKIIEIAQKYGKKIAVEGRSMKTNIEIAQQLGMIKSDKRSIISSQEADKIAPDKVVILATGAQGDEFAALMRMSNKSHKSIKLNTRDTIMLSSSIIPGNEKAVEKLKDNLSRQGAKIIHYRTSDVYIHSTGHGNKGELEWLHKKIKPKFFIPVHGNHYRLKIHAELAVATGLTPGNEMVCDNGDIVEIREKGTKIVKLSESAPSGLVMVDGFAIGDIQEVVLRDRQMLSQDGMFVIIASINTGNGKLRKSPDIISRGFVYLRESQDLLQQTRLVIKKTIEDTTAEMNPINFEFVKGVVTDNVARFLFQKTAKRPIVIPVLLGV